uniref:glutathione transferase n=1 Tax=Chelonoidis abingdonii TaxID=106734 RepID=A0A8C0GEV2_CHEAB
MVVELFLDLLSQPCRAVFIFAKKNNIPFEFKHVELLKGEWKAPVPVGMNWVEEFGKVNVLKKVPALKDGAFTLAESIAILLYLSRKFNTPDHWYPSDLQKRARVDEYLSWQHTTIREKGCKVFITKVLVPLILGEPFSPEKLETAVEELNSALKQFEEKFLQNKPFIVGNEISLADLMAIVELMEPVGCGCDIFENKPKLMEWRSRVEEAVGKELFQQAHEILLNVKNLSTTQLPPELSESLKQLLKP